MELAASPADDEVRVLVFLHMGELAGETAELPATVVTEEELLSGVQTRTPALFLPRPKVQAAMGQGLLQLDPPAQCRASAWLL